MDVIDMHNHFIAPEVIRYLARDGRHYATRIVEREDRRFFLIQEKALRPIDGPISDASARLADMEREGVVTQAVSCVPFPEYGRYFTAAQARTCGSAYQLWGVLLKFHPNDQPEIDHVKRDHPVAQLRR